MEDPRWIRLVAIGLILAALAIGYFLLSGRLSPTNITRTPPQVRTDSPSPTSVGSPTTSIQRQNQATISAGVLGRNNQVSPTSTPTSAFGAIAQRTQNGTQSLPSTGFPAGVAVALSLSVIIIGWGLRRFPK